ncbi:MAG: hypothetical protein ACKOW9_06440 [Candidatus Paceibacterota bacterium]
MQGPTLQKSLEIILNQPDLPRQLLSTEVSFYEQNGVYHQQRHTENEHYNPIRADLKQYLTSPRCKSKPCTAILKGLGSKAEFIGALSQSIASALNAMQNSVDDIDYQERYINKTLSYIKPADEGQRNLKIITEEYLTSRLTEKKKTFITYLKSKQYRDQQIEKAASQLLSSKYHLFDEVNSLLGNLSYEKITTFRHYSAYDRTQLITNLPQLLLLRDEINNLSPTNLEQVKTIPLSSVVGREVNSKENENSLITALTFLWREKLLMEIFLAEKMANTLLSSIKQSNQSYLITEHHFKSLSVTLEHQNLIHAYKLELKHKSKFKKPISFLALPFAIGELLITLNQASNFFALINPEELNYLLTEKGYETLETLTTLFQPDEVIPFNNLKTALSASKLL